MRQKTIEQVIRERRTVRALASSKLLTPKLVYELLESASYAPFHSKKEPWEVIMVHTKAQRKALADRLIDGYNRLDIWARYDQTTLEKSKKRTFTYYLDVPMTLIITAPICETEKENLEAIAAVSAFIQNFQLAAWEKQIGATWRTMELIFDRIFKQSLGVTCDRQIIGLLQLTTFDEKTRLPKAKRTPLDQWVSQLELPLDESSVKNRAN